MAVKIPYFKGEILVFEDNETNQQFVKSILVMSGFEVVIANNGRVGVDIVSERLKSGKKLFDLIFMDMYMPEMNGLDAVEALYELDVKTPIVIMTSNVTPEDTENYKAHGLSEVLMKPFSMEDAWECLKKYFTPVEYRDINQGRMAESEEERRTRLFTKFVKSNQTTYADIISAIEAGDIKLAHRLAHTLGGLAGLMKKAELRAAALTVENVLAKGSAEGLGAQLDVLERELNKVLEELAPYLEEPKQQAAETADFDKDKALEIFAKLETLLKGDSAKALDYVKELKAIPNTAALTEQIDDYEFEKALETLSSFKQTFGEFSGEEETETDKRRILVVDDESNNIDALCQILFPMYEVIVAKNGGRAIEKAKKYKPDIILLDIIMPDMTGFEVISNLKSSDVTRKIPIIFITGLNNFEDEEKGLMLGAVDYITKPFHGPIVKARVHTHLQNVEYINTIERLCMVDTLTNIPNRRGFDSRMQTEWKRAAREKNALSMFILDIDHFKWYNDSYGHPQGDVLLKAMGALFAQSLSRPADFVARWGGEEFVVLLPGTIMSEALHVAERIRANVERARVSCADGTVTNVTISIGVNSEVPYSSSQSIEEFISKADKALYAAKETGRNRVQAFSDL